MRPFTARPRIQLLLALLLAGSAMALCPVPGAAQGLLAAQSSVAGGVTVKVTPTQVDAGASTWVFAVVLDTHSGALSDDLQASAVLVTDDGREFLPTEWRGPGAGGHHREGTLAFAAPRPAPRSIELRIRRPGEPDARSFRWSL